MHTLTTTDVSNTSRKSIINQDLAAIFLVVMFFLPYFPGTPLRPDNLLGVLYIVLFIVIFLIKGRISFDNKHEKILTCISFAVIIYIFSSLLPYMSFPLQQTNYQLYLAVGMSIWCLHRRTLVTSRKTVVFTLLILSIPICALAVMQFLYNDSFIVHFFLRFYGGASSEEYDLANFGVDGFLYNNMAAIQVLTGTSMTSIFSGKHALAQYCLLVIAIGFGAYRDHHLGKLRKIFVSISIFLSLAAGFLSTSKVFFFAIPIFGFIYLVLSSGSKRIVQNISYIVVCISIAIVLVSFIAPQMRVLNDLVGAVFDGEVFSIFDSRFGQDGYLTSFNKVFESPLTWIFGVGAEAGLWRISDSQYRASILVGGLPYLLLFHSFVIYLLILNWRLRNSSPYAMPYFALGVSLLVAGIGIPVYWQARIVPIWVITNMLLVISYPSQKCLYRS